MDDASFRLFARPVRWVSAILIALVVICGSALWHYGPHDSGLSITVVWPERLSASTDAELVVVAQTYEDNATRTPLGGASVQLFQLDRTSPKDHRDPAEFVVEEALREVSSGQADATGQGVVRLPHTAAVEASAAPPEGALALRSDQAVELVVRVEHEGRVEWLYRSYGAPPGAALAISADRPLYQPGQTVKLRLLAVDPDTGRPLEAGAVTWEARDPRGNLIFKRTGALSAAGIAAVDLPLSPDGTQGEHSIQATVGNATATRVVEVQPFQLPRYKVQVKPAAAAVLPGEALTGTVEAIATWGDPVAEATVELIVRYPREGADGEARIEGKTDAEGRLAWSVALPPDATSGQATMTAVVSTDTGRAERGTATVKVGGGQVVAELLALGQGVIWRAGQANEGILIVSDGVGRPIAGAEVVLWLPEEREEQRVALTTDAAGRATFAWTPIYGQQVRMEITLPGGALLKRRLTPQVQGATVGLELRSVRAQVGEPIAFSLSGVSEDVTVVAFNRRYPVGSTRVLRGQGGGHEGSITLDSRSRGLTVLTVLGERGQTLTSMPVWVAQEGGDEITMKLDQDELDPGDSAALTLSFNAPEAEGGGDVTFGVVGVDEALYALRERVDQPLSILLRHDPDMVMAASLALERSGAPVDAQDALGQRVQVTRFTEAIAPWLGGESWRYSGGTSRELSREVARLRRLPWARAWVGLLALLGLGLVVVAARATVRPLGTQDFSVKRVFAFAGVMVGGGVLIVMAAAVSPEYMGGALTVWGGVVSCWLIATAIRNPRLPLSLWMWALLGMLIALLGITLTAAANDGSPNMLDGGFGVALGLLGLAALGLLLVEVFFWGMMLLARKLRKGGLGLATVLSLGVALLLASVFSLRSGSFSPGRYEESKMAMEMPMAASPAPASTGGERFVRLADADDNDREEAPPSPEPEPAEPNAPGASGPRVRSFFPETMLWIPELKANADGHARTAYLTFDVPDSITTWRINATANSTDGRFGEGQTALRVTKDFVVQIELPTHMTQDDVLEVPVVLLNRGDAPVTPSLTAAAEGGLRLLDSLPASVTLQPGEQASLRLSVVAERAGQGTLTVQGNLGDAGDGDAVRRAVTIAPDGRFITRSRSGIIGEGWSAALEVPQVALEGTVSSRTQVYPSVVADALDGLDGMLRMPTGCFEQASSATYPNVLVLQTLRTTPPEKWPGGAEAHAEAVRNAEELLTLGYQKMLSYQRPDGGFGLYTTSTDSSILLTAYGLMQLAALREVLPVEDSVFIRAIQYLVAHQNKEGSWPVYAGRISGGDWTTTQDPGQIRSTAFVTWAILLSPVARSYPQPTQRGLKHLADNLDALDSPDALAWAANALLTGKHEQGADRALTRLVGMAKREGDITYWPAQRWTWMGGWGRYADLETTALTTHALLLAQREPELLSGALRYLAQARSPWGGWGSTQATVWSLRTLARLRSLGDQPVTLTLKLDGQPLLEDRPGADAQQGSLRVEPGDLLMHTLRPAEGALTPGAHTVAITPSGSTAAMTQASVTYAVPWSSPLAAVPNERLKIATRPLTATSPRSRDLWITAAITNPVADPLGATIVELPRPPGAWVDPAPFEAMQREGGIDRFELLPTHIRLYLSAMQPEATRTFRYTVRPLMRGTFTLPPTRAYAFYVPDPISEAPSGRVRVE